MIGLILIVDEKSLSVIYLIFRMNFTCPDWSDGDGGYSSHDTSQEEDISTFCYRNYLGIAIITIDGHNSRKLIGYAYPIVTSKDNKLLLSQHPALPSFELERKGRICHCSAWA